MTESESVDLRCPVGPQRLFAKLRLSGETSPRVTEDNLVEFACDDCKRTLRARGRRGEFRVLHRFNFLGELVESATESAPARPPGR